MGAIARKLRDARRFEVAVDAADPDGIRFILRRPTDLEMIDLRGTASGERLLRFLVGWKNVKESDLVASGDPHPVEFDADDAREWLADRPDHFALISSSLMSAYNAHMADLEEKLKNSTAGSTLSATDASQPPQQPT